MNQEEEQQEGLPPPSSITVRSLFPLPPTYLRSVRLVRLYAAPHCLVIDALIDAQLELIRGRPNVLYMCWMIRPDLPPLFPIS